MDGRAPDGARFSHPRVMTRGAVPKFPAAYFGQGLPGDTTQRCSSRLEAGELVEALLQLNLTSYPSLSLPLCVCKSFRDQNPGVLLVDWIGGVLSL
jgi:hypothetical protein